MGIGSRVLPKMQYKIFSGSRGGWHFSMAQVLEQQVASLAEGRGSGNIDHGEDDHRRDRFQHVSRFLPRVMDPAFVLSRFVLLFVCVE